MDYFLPYNIDSCRKIAVSIKNGAKFNQLIRTKDGKKAANLDQETGWLIHTNQDVPLQSEYIRGQEHEQPFLQPCAAY